MQSSRHIVAALGVLAVAAALAVAFALASPGSSSAAAGDCKLSADGSIKHLIYLQFDNTHFARDRADVPSDLEQMPHLLNFLTSNGTLLTNDHTILISHTAGGILSSLTGLYPDRNGQTVSNSYDYYRNNGTPTFTSSFKYWTAPVDGADDSKPNMIADTGLTTPAPWVPYTRAGCDFGGVGTANLELENNLITPGGDIANVFGNPSPQASEPAALRTTDFVGIAIHCAQNASSRCSGNTDARTDPLPDEPGGYAGYQALFGTKYVDPAITGGNPCVNDTNGQPIQDPAHNCGFPGFDGMLAKNSLGYVAQMQENGVPVTYAYISDAHDNHTLFRASGPGEADYKQQLADYDAAFAAFFQRLQAHGIDKSNTLFVVTVDEGDHFAGGTGTPDGSGDLTYTHTACPLAPIASTCPANQIGEVNVKIGAVLPAGEPAYDIHFDDAPTFYVNGDAGHPNGPAGPTRRCASSSVTSRTRPPPIRTRAGAFRLRSSSSTPSGRRRSTWSTPIRSGRRRSRCSATPTSSSRRRTSRRVCRVDRVCQPGVRLEPRRHPGGDREHVGRLRRPRRPGEWGRLQHLDRPHRTSGRRSSRFSASRTTTCWTVGH